jgi:eukaryotic-like serine/threonine-protein kinase
VGLQLTCPQGHRWEAPATGSHDTKQLCPKCGAAPVASLIGSGNAGVSIAATLPQAVPALPVPGIAGYEILGELGRGGMGVVYKAQRVALKRLVALKMVLAGAHAGSVELARFRAEAEAVARLQHPNIVQIYEVGEHEGRAYCALEYVAGGSLAQHLAGKPLAPAVAGKLVVALAAGVQHAHEHGIVHRDLKPANVLLGDNGIPKVTDFGLAKTLDTPDGPTKSGTVLGTPSYMAPEQALGQNRAIGPATDIYSLGAILYECLTGRPPFKAETSLDTMLQVASQDPVSPRQINGQVPRDLETICLKCLRKEPARRYASARELADDLGRFLRNEPIRARPVGPLERAVKWARRRPAWSAALALVLLLPPLTGAVIWKAQRRGPSPIGQTEPAPIINADEHMRYAQQIGQADQERLEGKFNRAQEILGECSPRLRGWEWDYLQRLCSWGMRRTLTDCGGAVRQVAFGRDGRLAVVAGSPGVQVRDASSGKVLARLGEGHGRVNAVAFSPDGKQLVSAGADHWLRVYDTTSSQEVAARDQGGPVHCVAFSPDGKWLAAGGGELLNAGFLWLWSAPLGKEPVRKCGFHTRQVVAVTFFPNSTQFTSLDLGGELHGWLTAGGEISLPRSQHGYQHLVSVPRSPAVGLLSSLDNRLAFLMPPQTIVNGYADPPKRGFETLNLGAVKMEQAPFDDQSDPRPGGASLAAGFNADETMLALAGGRPTQGKVRVYRGSRLNASVLFFGHTQQVSSVSFAPDRPLLASGSDDGSVCIWDPTVRRFDAAFASSAHAVLAPAPVVSGPPEMAFSPDSQRLATLTADPLTVDIWDLQTGRKTVCPRLADQGALQGPYFSQDGRLAALTGESTRTICIWDGQTGAKAGTFPDQPLSVGALASWRQGFLLASSVPDQPVKASGGKPVRGIQLIDPVNGKKLRTVGEESFWLSWPVLSPNGERLAAISKEGVVHLWDAGTGQVLLKSPGRGMLRFSSDGRYLLRNNPQESLEIWDAQSGQPAGLRLPAKPVREPVQFAPDGKLLAWPVEKGEVLLWNASTGRPVATLRGHGSAVDSALFSSDGRRLFTVGSDDSTVKVWDTTTGLEMCTLRHAKGSNAQLLLSPDGRRLALRSTGGTFVWDATPVAPEPATVK